MKRGVAAILLVLAACSEVDQVANCSELDTLLSVSVATLEGDELNTRFGDIWLKGREMEEDALTRGAEVEARLCSRVASDAFDRALDSGGIRLWPP